MQQGMLFHTLYEPKSGVYLEQFCLTLYGNLDISGFEQAWIQVVKRHAVLRTFVIWEKQEKPLQIVCKQVDLPWTNYDWRSLSAKEQQQRLEAFLQADRDQGFALDKAPLMRCSLIQVADDTYEFIWTSHHLLMDGWSWSIILKEVFAFYNALIEGKYSYLKSLSSYRDFINWLQKQDLRAAQAFWRQQLQGFTSPTPLVVDSPTKTLRKGGDTHKSQRRRSFTCWADPGAAASGSRSACYDKESRSNNHHPLVQDREAFGLQFELVGCLPSTNHS